MAGVDFHVASARTLLHYGDAPYEEFLLPAESGPSADHGIHVEVLASPAPETDAPVVFDCGAWWMQRDAGGYWVSLRRTDEQHVHTVLRADPLTTRVAAYVEQDRLAEVGPHDGVMNPLHYPVDQLLLMHHLALRGGIICHAAAVAVDGGALVFPGVSGAGKTTISRAFIEAGLSDALLSDDRIILRWMEQAENGAEAAGSGRPLAWGTPWPGDAQIARNRSEPVAALMFLVQSAEDRLAPIGPAAAMRRLMPMVSSPWYDSERLPAVLETCGRLVERTPCYELHFRRDGRVVDLLTTKPWS